MATLPQMKSFLTRASKKSDASEGLKRIANALKNFRQLDKGDQKDLNDLVRSAYAKLKSKPKATSTPKKATPKKTDSFATDLDKFKKKVGKVIFRRATSGTDIVKDAKRPALKSGKRIVRKQGYTSNQYGTFENKVGTPYWESRSNRMDVNQPSQRARVKLADGGSLGNIGDPFSFDVKAKNKNGENVKRTMVSYSSNEKMAKEKLLDFLTQKLKYTDVKISNGRKGHHPFAKGGEVDNDYSTFKYYKVPNENFYAIQECDINGENCGVIRHKKTEKDAIEEIQRLTDEQGFRRNMNARKRIRSNEDTYPKGTKFAKGGEVEDELIEYTIPTWALSSLINGDDSGLEDEDIEKIDKFVAEVVDTYGNANFMLGEESEESHFSYFNDIDRLGSDVTILYIRPSKKYAKGGEVGKSYTYGNEGYSYTNNFGVDQADFIKLVDVYHNTYPLRQTDRIVERLTYREFASKYGEEKLHKVMNYIHQTHKIHEGRYAKGGSVSKGIEQPSYEEGIMISKPFYSEEKSFFGLAKGYKITNKFKENITAEFIISKNLGISKKDALDKANAFYNFCKKAKTWEQYEDLSSEFIKEWNAKEKYAKGGKLSSRAKYIPNRNIEEVEVNQNGKTRFIDGADILDGFYLKKKGKFAEGGEIDKQGMIYALAEHISSGEIANRTDILDYDTISKIRTKAIQYYFENGDKPYSFNEMDRILKEIASSDEISRMKHFQTRKMLRSDENTYPKGTEFANGGELDDAKIYVADLMEYNNGKLVGKWLNLSDYSSGSEVLEAIQEFLDEQTKKDKYGEVHEEYAIHDYEGFPRSFYSEYMGEGDFDNLYEIMRIADSSNLPVDVLMEAMSDLGYEDNAERVAEAYYSSIPASMGNEFRDFAYEYIDSIGSITDAVSNPEFYFDYESFGSDVRMDYTEEELEEMGYDELDDTELGETLVDEQGGVKNLGQKTIEMYFDYDKFGRDLEYDFIAVRGKDGDYYFFNRNFAKGGEVEISIEEKKKSLRGNPTLKFN